MLIMVTLNHVFVSLNMNKINNIMSVSAVINKIFVIAEINVILFIPHSII